MAVFDHDPESSATGGGCGMRGHLCAGASVQLLWGDHYDESTAVVCRDDKTWVSAVHACARKKGASDKCVVLKKEVNIAVQHKE